MTPKPLTIRWDESMGCYRVSEPNFATAGPERVYREVDIQEALDWERCRTCNGRKFVQVGECGPPGARLPITSPCSTCEGFGSLKSRALALLIEDLPRFIVLIQDADGWTAKNGRKVEPMLHEAILVTQVREAITTSREGD